jgi:hypothetical protein
LAQRDALRHQLTKAAEGSRTPKWFSCTAGVRTLLVTPHENEVPPAFGFRANDDKAAQDRRTP